MKATDAEWSQVQALINAEFVRRSGYIEALKSECRPLIARFFNKYPQIGRLEWDFTPFWDLGSPHATVRDDLGPERFRPVDSMPGTDNQLRDAVESLEAIVREFAVYYPAHLGSDGRISLSRAELAFQDLARPDEPWPVLTLTDHDGQAVAFARPSIDLTLDAIARIVAEAEYGTTAHAAALASHRRHLKTAAASVLHGFFQRQPVKRVEWAFVGWPGVADAELAVNNGEVFDQGDSTLAGVDDLMRDLRILCAVCAAVAHDELDGIGTDDYGRLIAEPGGIYLRMSFAEFGDTTGQKCLLALPGEHGDASEG